jgi:hypothetical protein
VIGQVRLEEVVDESVDVEHRAVRGFLGAAAHERGDDLALVVVRQRDGQGFVGFSQYIGLRLDLHGANSAVRCQALPTRRAARPHAGAGGREVAARGSMREGRRICDSGCVFASGCNTPSVGVAEANTRLARRRPLTLAPV